jgi:hypothetical protein
MPTGTTTTSRLLGVTSGTALGDGADTDMAMRRAELVFKGKGPGMWSWVVGYDARADKFLDANIAYKFSGFTTMKVGQFKQPNSLEELSSTKNNDFISKAMTTNLQAVARRVGVSASTGADNWSITGSAFTRELTRNLGEGNGFGARGTWAPILDTEGNTFLHLGLSYVDFEARDPGSAVGVTPVVNGDGRARFRVRPDADLTATAWSIRARSSTATGSRRWPGRRLRARPVQGPGRVHEDRRVAHRARRLRLRQLVRVRRLEPDRRDLGLQGRRRGHHAAGRAGPRHVAAGRALRPRGP